MKKIKFLFFTLLFCFSVPVKADTAFENDDTCLLYTSDAADE